MKARDLRWFLAGYATLLLIAMVVRSDDLIGVNLSWGNGEYSYRAGSAPWAVAFAIVGIGLYVALTVGRVDASARPLPDLFRRWAAGMTDFVTAMMVWGPFIGLVALAAEYKRTGAFDWLIERQEYQPGDWLASGRAGVAFNVCGAACIFCLSVAAWQTDTRLLYFRFQNLAG